MPALRVDWQKIRGLAGDPARPFIFIIPDGSRQLFLAIADMLSWEATYRAYGYDYADWDTLQEVHDLGVNGLLGGVPLDELLALIDDVEPLLTEIRDRECCPDDSMPVPGTDDSGPVGVETDTTGDDVIVGTGDPPGDHADWPSYESHLCDAATKFAEGVPRLMDLYSTASTLVQLSLTAVIGLVAAAFAGFGLTGAIMAGALGIIDFFALVNTIRDAIAGDNPWSAHKTALSDSELQEDLICAFVLNSTAAGAYNAVVTALNTHAPAAAPHVLRFPIELAIRRIYNADSDAAGGFGGGCEGCAIESDFVATHETFSSPESFTSVCSATGPTASCGADTLQMNPNASGCNGSQFILTFAQAAATDGFSIPMGDQGKLRHIELSYSVAVDYVGSGLVLQLRYANTEHNVDIPLPSEPGSHTFSHTPAAADEFVPVPPTHALRVAVGAGGGNSATNLACLETVVTHWISEAP